MEKFNLRKIIINSLVVFVFFIFDRASKLYILNLAEKDLFAEIYINSFLNFHLIWNSGIGFGLLSLESNFYYDLITTLIILINIVILMMILRSNNYNKFFLLMLFGGSLGNLFDRIYYNAVPDFIDIHYYTFHWFIFNVADIFISIAVLCLIFRELFLKN